MFPGPKRRAARPNSGFSLIELLIVIAIILIILAVALPKAHQRPALRTGNGGHEGDHHHPHGRDAILFAVRPVCDHAGATGPSGQRRAGPNGAELIDRDLASGEKGGFKFVLQQTPTGYALAVTPTAFGTSGTHTYFSDQSMAIHRHNGQEPATANDPLLGETQQQQQQQAPAAAPPTTAPAP